jgi:hypothetical protein
MWMFGEAEFNQMWAVVNGLSTKVDKVMATIADVQAALSANETREATIIQLLGQEKQQLADTKALLEAAIASGADPAALQTIVDKMTTDGTNMDAAIASINPPAAPFQAR